jgi:actin-related protein
MSSEKKNPTRPLILDIGRNNFRLGWAGSDYPEIIAPSIYADNQDYLFSSDVIEGLGDIFVDEENPENQLFGNEALKYSNVLKVHELKNNYNILMKYFYFHYKQLEIENEFTFKQPIIVMTPFFMSELEKTKLKDIFFNVFEFPALIFLPDSQGVLSILQKPSAVIVNMGESNTYITTFLHGFTNIMARDTFPIAGKELTNALLNMLLKGSGKNVYLDRMIAKEIKEKLAVCVLNPEGEEKRIKDGFTKYKSFIDLPDGSKLEINSERFQLVEPLFDPSKIHIDYISLPEAIAKVIQSWDREDWSELLPNIVLAGGGSLIPGLEKRLKVEISKFFSERLRGTINVVATTGRDTISWVGASVLWAQGKLTKGWEYNPKVSTEESVQENTDQNNN